MAVVRTKQDSFVTTKIEEKSGFGGKSEVVKKPESKKVVKTKGGNFLFNFIASTWAELRKSEWPTFKYVTKWGSVIIIFTAIFSVSLGFFDNTFNSAIRFVDCTSPKSRAQDVSKCTTELLEKITYR